MQGSSLDLSDGMQGSSFDLSDGMQGSSLDLSDGMQGSSLYLSDGYLPDRPPCRARSISGRVVVFALECHSTSVLQHCKARSIIVFRGVQKKSTASKTATSLPAMKTAGAALKQVFRKKHLSHRNCNSPDSRLCMQLDPDRFKPGQVQYI
ncbi:hypothetical protein CHS0354_004486 [Potamilus streckersoni]|uniref:Uncharacterized protein n=1 Tax=Potamilus streckersoni TaxID=2493646 RepID=A0AAE0SP93_9BIVA|nr:hypothetical protein CHS0354_004486 [Potamilus streckersoni]